MKKVIRVLFFLAVVSFIYYMSSQNAVKSSNCNVEAVRILRVKGGVDLYSLFGKEYVDIIIRKLGHFLEFSLLGTLLYSVLSAFKVRWSTILTSILGIAFAVLDEFHQLYVMGRSSSIIDVAIDSLGVLAALSAVSLIRVIRFELSSQEVNYGMKYYHMFMRRDK